MLAKFRALPTQSRVVLIVSVAAAVLLVVIIAAHGSSSDGSGGSHVSGSRDDWLQAVCKDGSYRTPTRDMPVFRSASGAGICLARTGGTIFIGQWDSDCMMRNALSGARLSSYAAASDGQGVTAFAPAPNAPERALEPLSQFGFTIHELAPPDR
jgi:hypothetical protein